ncbi:zinc finger BED domain-containing protein 4-like isoform X7 [Syngnathus typhle]|uniref:zinc finger BED domain-containing protein 4-like isoform X7 n=1 Tax=Syngnathus typhle TaxID=161592 RepID=UPI002A6A23BA|nr:zinc finger BED domain-containing protein 4-like isoform X7 [Syngnathus typhle]
MEMESKHVLFLTNNQVERKPELNEDKQEKPANGGRSDKMKAYNKLKLLKRQRKKLERQEVRMEKEMFQGRVRRVVSFFHRSTLANAVLKEKQKLLDLPPHKLIQDVITRWNSSFDMVERFLEQQAAVCAAQLDQKIRKSMKNDLQTLNEEDMSTAEEIIQLLRPVKTATTIMCEEAQLTISVIAPLKSKLIEHFSVCEDDMPLIKEMKQTMAKELKHRYTDVQEVLNTAAALDARFKTLPFLCKEERDATFKNIINEAAHLWDQKEDTQAHDGTAMEETHTTHPSEEACDDELHASEYVPVSKKNQSNGGSVWGHIHC